MSKELLIGVLGLQGDIEENIKATTVALREMNLKGKVISVRYPEEIMNIDGLIIPGGESTVMGLLISLKDELLHAMTRMMQRGLPVMGTCAGMMGCEQSYDMVIGTEHDCWDFR